MAKKDRDKRLLRQVQAGRAARVRTRGRLTLVGTVLVGLFALLLPFGVADAWSQERAFERAVACDAVTAPLPASSPDCVLSAPGTVVSLHQALGKNARQFVNLSSLGGTTGDISFYDSGFYNGLTVGESLTATFWRGGVVRLSAGGVTTATDANPTGHAAGFLLFSLLSALGALWLGFLSFWYLRRTRLAAAIPAPPAFVLPVRVAWTTLGIGAVVAICAAANLRFDASVGSMLRIPALIAAALALAASTLFIPWMRRPGEVHFKR